MGTSVGMIEEARGERADGRSARHVCTHTPASTLEVEYRRRRVCCDCAHASIWCGPAQVWLPMAVDVKVRRASARAQWSCYGSLPRHLGVCPAYGPSSRACVSTFCRHAQRGIPGVIARVAEDGEARRSVCVSPAPRGRPEAGHREHRVRTGRFAEQCDGQGTRLSHPVRPAYASVLADVRSQASS